MASHQLIVLSNSRDGRDEEFNDWYDRVHLPDVLAVGGVVGARRYRMREGDRWRYLAIYELDCYDPSVVTQELLARAGTERMPLSDAFDMESYFMDVATPMPPGRD